MYILSLKFSPENWTQVSVACCQSFEYPSGASDSTKFNSMLWLLKQFFFMCFCFSVSLHFASNSIGHKIDNLLFLTQLYTPFKLLSYTVDSPSEMFLLFLSFSVSFCHSSSFQSLSLFMSWPQATFPR